MATNLIGKNALICGDARTLQFTFPYDITGHTIFFTVRSVDSLTSSDDTDALIAKTKSSSHEDPTNGYTEIDLTKTDTRIPAGIYRYDVQDVDGSGNPSSTKVFKIEFTNDSTKDTS